MARAVRVRKPVSDHVPIASANALVGSMAMSPTHRALSGVIEGLAIKDFPGIDASYVVDAFMAPALANIQRDLMRLAEPLREVQASATAAANLSCALDAVRDAVRPIRTAAEWARSSLPLLDVSSVLPVNFGSVQALARVAATVTHPSLGSTPSSPRSVEVYTESATAAAQRAWRRAQRRHEREVEASQRWREQVVNTLAQSLEETRSVAGSLREAAEKQSRDTERIAPFEDQVQLLEQRGRPSHWPLVKAEFLRRRKAAALQSSVTATARSLSMWLTKTHQKSLSFKTIRNRLIREFPNTGYREPSGRKPRR